MKKVIIEIEGNFGSIHKEQYAKDSLLNLLKGWKICVKGTHKQGELKVTINGNKMQHLDWFNWINTK